MRPDDTQDTADLLQCPPAYLKTFPSSSPSSLARDTRLLASRDWLHQLTTSETLPEDFPTHPDYSDSEIEAFLSEAQLPSTGWCLLSLKTIPVNFKPKITQSNNQKGAPQHDDLTLPEIVQYINKKSFESVWRSAGKTSQESSLPGSWEEQLLDLLFNIYGKDLPVIRPEDDGDLHVHLTTEAEALSPPTNLVPASCLILTKNFAILVQPFQATSVLDLLKFSPAIISETSAKYLFILYQILEVYKTLCSRGLSFGDKVTLSHFKINEALHVLYEPPLILEEITTSQTEETTNVVSDDSNTADSPSCLSLSEATARWCRREISNLEYLLVLNREAGRVFGQPNNHPVVPWVCDFSSPDGGLRDLTKSKFRLNKGDVALDLTYESGQHHVTEVLSEITYYTYKSRVTDKATLCKYVRQSWVPEEYPATIQR